MKNSKIKLSVFNQIQISIEKLNTIRGGGEGWDGGTRMQIIAKPNLG